MKNRSKGIAFVIIVVVLIVIIVAAGVVVYIVVVKPPAPGPGPGQGFQITEIEDYGDLVNYVSHIKYMWTSYFEGETSTDTTTFDDLGDDEVNGFNCRKFEMEITSDGDTSEIEVWILKDDWTTVKKLMIDGEEIPEEDLYLYYWIGPVVFSPYTTFFAWGIAWAVVPSEIGTLTPTGSGSNWYGATLILYNKWLFTPNPTYEPLEDLESIEIWQGQAGSYYLFTYFKVTEDDGDWFEFELLELTT